MAAKRKNDILKGLLSGKMTLAEAMPKQVMLLETVEIGDKPERIYYKFTGEEITLPEVEAMMEKAKKLRTVVLNEVSTYLTWDDFKNGRQWFNGDAPIE